MQVNVKDAAAGGIFIVIAALFALGTRELTIGSALRMGPGYFPLLLAGVLGLLGAVILAKSVRKAPEAMGVIPWRGAFFILLAPIVFGLTVRGFNAPGGFHFPGLGLAPSVALVIAISTFASRRATLKLALLLTIGLTLFCIVVFQKLLGLPIPVFAGPFDVLNPWLDAAFAPFVAAFAAIKTFALALVGAIRGLFGS